ncbi:hypothetical protein SAMN05421847_1386 [Halpernia humi]|uniref:TRASH domain-containing protein n=1 Tax=Halpernia humi TaxID=493375 RepID=A0A1H5WZY2_9FLAO|nr:hypothetical protein [Halpernia humi]SEG04785.1 hypothetical protein SAMN05421847_1386 [Halpernia humi]
MKNLIFGIMAIFALFLTSCKKSETATPAKTEMASASNEQPKVGDIVPNEKVCMVNNAYMGKKQLEVKYNGKTYYGCCADCQKKIPTDETARTAYDPISKNPVDKSVAIIAKSDENDAVLYFENEANYKEYFQKN